MKIAAAVLLLVCIIACALSVYADVTVSTDTPTIPSAPVSPANGDSIVLIITVLCLSAAALVALLITSIIMKRKK